MNNQQTPEQLLEGRTIQFDMHIDRLVAETKEALRLECHAHRFPHASNLLVTGIYTPMELARCLQTTFVPRPKPEILKAWHLKYGSSVTRSQTISYFADEEVLHGLINEALDHELHALRKARYQKLKPSTETIKHGTGDFKVDIDRVYYFPNATSGFLELSQLYMNCFDDKDLHKTDLEIVVIMP